MFIKRKDKGCESRVLAVNEETGRVLIEARWPIGAKPPQLQRNIVHVREDYFRQKYGKDPRECLA